MKLDGRDLPSCSLCSLWVFFVCFVLFFVVFLVFFCISIVFIYIFLITTVQKCLGWCFLVWCPSKLAGGV